MNSKTIKKDTGCLTEEKALEFVLEELSEEEEMHIAEHLADCPKCLALVRASRLLYVWTARAHAEASRACYEECFLPAAAAAPGTPEVIVLENAAGGRYRVRLHKENPPGSRWLLVVEPKFPCPDGSEIVVSNGVTELSLRVDSSRAVKILDNPFSLQQGLQISCNLARQDGP